MKKKLITKKQNNRLEQLSDLFKPENSELHRKIVAEAMKGAIADQKKLIDKYDALYKNKKKTRLV